MSTQEVASRLVEMCRQGQNMEALSELYAEHCVSREMPGMPNVLTEGLTAIKAKSENWYATVEEFHGGEVSDPVVAGNYFTCKMSFDITVKGQGRSQNEELCIYEVTDGKITSEQFFYSMD